MKLYKIALREKYRNVEILYFINFFIFYYVAVECEDQTISYYCDIQRIKVSTNYGEN